MAAIRSRTAVAVAAAVVVIGTVAFYALAGDSPSTNPQPVEARADSLALCWTFPDRTDSANEARRLVDVTDELGLIEPLTGMHGHATAVGDVDGDGWTDLFVGTFGDRPDDAYRHRGAEGPAPDRMLLGGPDGFRIDPSFPLQRARTSGAQFVDLDDDGDLDLVLARNLKDGSAVHEAPTQVLTNDDGAFTASVDLPTKIRARAVAPIDHDHDGDLDFVLVGDRFGRTGTQLWRNDGNFTFTDVSADAGLPDDLYGLAAAVVDFDGDGLIDVHVPGDRRVLLGQADGGFTLVDVPVLASPRSGAEDLTAAGAVGDLDRDGRPDLVVGHHFGSADETSPAGVRVLFNRSEPGTVVFHDITDDLGLPEFATKAPHVQISDLDADGRADIVISASSAGGDEPTILWGDDVGDGVGLVNESTSGTARYWVTGALLDADRDGDQEIFLAEWEPTLPSRVWEVRRAGRLIELDLSGLAHGGIGARVEAFEVGRPDERLTTVWSTGTTGYAAGADAVVRIGIGDRDAVDLKVTDATGSETAFDVVAGDASYRIGTCLPT